MVPLTLRICRWISLPDRGSSRAGSKSIRPMAQAAALARLCPGRCNSRTRRRSRSQAGRYIQQRSKSSANVRDNLSRDAPDDIAASCPSIDRFDLIDQYKTADRQPVRKRYLEWIRRGVARDRANDDVRRFRVITIRTDYDRRPISGLFMTHARIEVDPSEIAYVRDVIP